jgi:tetratricopeptide (TPR) repeat protein
MIPILRTKTQFNTILLLSLFVYCTLSIGCRTKSTAVSIPKNHPPEIGTEAMSYIQRGDTYLSESHLYAWRQAEAFYKKAYDITQSSEIRKKLLLARFLILIRQIDESIPYALSDEVTQELCAGDSYQKTLCSIAEWFKNGKNPQFFKSNPPIFRGEDPTVESYLNLLLFQAIPQIDAFSRGNAIDSSATLSPLFLYLNDWKLTLMNPKEFETVYPQFAEGYKILADSLYQKKKYRLAQKFYQKSAELIPDYVTAYIGLGNLYFYGMDDPDRALGYYTKALKVDAVNIPALFGQGLTLNQLGKLAESNTVLDRMLTDTPIPIQWPNTANEVRYYKGQTYYLKASNQHLMNDAIKARQFIDSAQKLLPDSQEINYLSGILFYQAHDLESSRRDFLLATERGSYPICDAQFHLGLIHNQLKPSIGNPSVTTEKSTAGFNPLAGSGRTFENEPIENRAQQYFLSAASCMESSVGKLTYQIKNLNSLDLDKKDLQLFKSRLENKLLDLRMASFSTIERILTLLSQDNSDKNTMYISLLNEILTRLRNP